MTPEEMERFLNQRKDSSEDALMDELKRMTREQEQTGEMSPTRMEEIYATLSPSCRKVSGRRCGRSSGG